MPTRQRQVYHGWWLVLGLALIGAVMTAMGGVNFGLFIDPMTKDLGIGQSVFGLAQTARLVGFAATGWLVGRYLDRHGARVPLIVAGLVFGATVFAVAFITAGWQLILLFFIGGLTGLQGAGGNLYTTVPITRWFLRKRGRAMAIAFLGIPVGIFIFAPLTQVFIDHAGWRATWAVAGVFGGAVTVLVAILVVRRAPEDLGLEVDGASESEGSPEERRLLSRLRSEYSWSRAEAMATSAFWRLAAIDGVRMGAMSTLSLFRVPYYIDNGVSAQVVAFALSCEAVVAGAVGLAAGWLIDRFSARSISAASGVAQVLAIIVTIGADTPLRVFIAASMFGVGAQSFSVSQGMLWPDYFGVREIGKIRGVAMPMGLALSAVAAPLTGLVKDQTGSFIPAWTVAGVALALCTLLLLATPRPQPPSVATGETAERAAPPALPAAETGPKRFRLPGAAKAVFRPDRRA